MQNNLVTPKVSIGEPVFVRHGEDQKQPHCFNFLQEIECGGGTKAQNTSGNGIPGIFI